MQSQKRHPRCFSFEFFPPKTPEGMEKLRATWKQLAQLKPRFFSCTYGAGGSTRDRTLETVLEIQAAGHRAAPHISCVGATRDDIAATLELYKSKGIGHIVALRGDQPSGAASAGELRYASELVAFIRERTGDDVASIRSLGLDVVTDLCNRLLSAGAPGLHFYTMNQAGLTSTIWQRLGIC